MTPCECCCWQTFTGVGSLHTPRPCPMPASVSCQDHEELQEGTRKRQCLSDAWLSCNHLSHFNGLLVISFCHHKPPWYHLTQPLLLIASKICTCSCCYQTLQLCTQATGLVSAPQLVHTWHRNRLLAEPTLTQWLYTICFPPRSKFQPRFETFVKPNLSHHNLGNHCSFLTPSSASL